jgi:multicomponent K+:H+ antiporter subunit D
MGAEVLAVSREAFGEGEEEDLDEEEAGIAIPAATAILGMSFMGCALVLAGLPPLSGFLAKFAMLAPLFAAGERGVSPVAGLLLGAFVVSGLVTVIAMTRLGIDVFWTSPSPTVRIRLSEIGPVLLLLSLCVALAVRPGPVMQYMEATARSLYAPQDYVRGILGEGEPLVPTAQQAVR